MKKKIKKLKIKKSTIRKLGKLKNARVSCSTIVFLFASISFVTIGAPQTAHGTIRSIEGVPIWKLVLETRTADRGDADTNGRVRARLKLRSGGTVDLDTEYDDRERGHTDIYVIDPWSVRTVSDIEQLELYISSNDGWCIDYVALKVNNDSLPIYEHDMSPCFWIDGNGATSTLVINSTTLRDHPNWTLDGHNQILDPRPIIRGDELERMIEGAVGNAMGELNWFEWGRKYGRSHVEVKRLGAHTTGVDLDLAADLSNLPWGRASEIDLNFTISWRCIDDHLDFDLQNFRFGDDPDKYNGYGFHRDKGRIIRSVEDMLLRLRLRTDTTNYRCDSDPIVLSDGGINPRIVRRLPTYEMFVANRNLHYNSAPATETSFEDQPVWDLVLETETGDSSSARTNASVSVQLGAENDKSMYLNLGIDDREPNSLDRYHVSVPGVHTVSDIHMLDLRLPRNDDDGWCVDRIALYLNGDPDPIFQRSYESCVMVDTVDDVQVALTFSFDELRDHPGWGFGAHTSSMQTPPGLITPWNLQDRMETAIGHRMGYNGLYWEDCGSRPCLEVERGSGRSLYVRAQYNTGSFYATWYDVAFDVEFRCSGGQLTTGMRHFGGHANGHNDIIDSNVSDHYMDLASRRFGDMLKNITIDYKCTDDPRFIDYGHLILPLEVR